MGTIIDKFKLTGRKAIVTGGSRGIGKAITEAFCEAGADVAIADIVDEKLGEKTAESVASECGSDVKTMYIPADVTKPEDMDAAVAKVVASWERLDILVNNAGICKNIPAEEMTREDWLAVINVNFNGVFYASQAAGRQMIKQKSGTIINIGSMSGIIVNYPQPQVSYNAAKAGVHMMTKSLATEWAKHNVRVNCVAPGYVGTELLTPFKEKFPEEYQKYWLDGAVQGRVGKPEEIAGACVYLASDIAAYATGTVFLIDGGYTLR